MNALEFLSVRPASAGPRLRSPLERALRERLGLHDLSLALAKFDVRGDLDGVPGVIRITPRRGLVVAPIEEAERTEAALRSAPALVVDVTAALAALRIERPDAATLMRRLTDLDLDALPAAGAVARIRAVVRGGGTSFDLFWPQEYGHYLAEVVVHAAERAA